MTDKLEVHVTYDANRGGYIGTVPGLSAPVVALSLGGLRKRIEAALAPDEPIVMLNLDRSARIERDQRRRALR
jgi:hypothetical protein